MSFVITCKNRKKNLLANKAVYEKKIAEYAKGMQDLYMDKVKGLIGEADFVVLSKNISQEKERLLKLVQELQSKIIAIDNKITASDNRRELIEQYTNLEHLDRNIVDTLIDYIIVDKRIQGTRNVPIEIHWAF